MSKKKKHKESLDFNGGWPSGEAAHHIGKKVYTRKNKHKNLEQ